MEIVDKIDKSLTEALKNKDQDRTLTLRSIISQKKHLENLAFLLVLHSPF